MARSLVAEPITSPWMTRDETAAYARVHPLTIDNMAADGRLKAYYLGPRVKRFHRADIDAAFGRSA